MTILADTSAWVEYLRATGSPVGDAIRHGLRTGELATTDAVVLEVLVGAGDEEEATRLTRLLARCEHLPHAPWADAEAAAGLYRTCRRAGETVRSLSDCVIAAVAIRHDVAVLHRDRDFATLGRHTGVELVEADGSD